jgi:hypothetical protein
MTFGPVQLVNITRGFWRGHEGVVLGKVPFLPLYRVYVGYKRHYSANISKFSYLFTETVSGHWLWGWCLASHTEPLSNRELAIAAGKFLHSHFPGTLSREHDLYKEIAKI